MIAGCLLAARLLFGIWNSVARPGAPPASLVTGEGKETFSVDASMELKGKLLDWRFVDVPGDDALELVLVVSEAGRERELRVHRLRGGTLDPESLQKISLLRDILAWGVADVRSEAGKELLLMTPGGIWSYSFTLRGYRDNVQPLVRADLIFDVANPRDCDYWAYVLPGPGRDLLVVPERDGATLWGPPLDTPEVNASDASAPAAYVRLVDLEVSLKQPRPARAIDEQPSQPLSAEAQDGDQGRGASLSIGSAGVDVDIDGEALFLREDVEPGAELLSASFSIDAPALLDIDGDGLDDLVAELPPRGEMDLDNLFSLIELGVSWHIADLDGQGAKDLIVVLGSKLRVYLEGSRTGPDDSPDQVLKSSGNVLYSFVRQAQGDDLPDLQIVRAERISVGRVLRAFVLPSAFDFDLFTYRNEGGTFSRKPTRRNRVTFELPRIFIGDGEGGRALRQSAGRRRDPRYPSSPRPGSSRRGGRCGRRPGR